MSDALHEFDCPLCEGSFEVESQWLGQTIPCPHCNEDVMLPAVEEPAVNSPPEAAAPESMAAPTPAPEPPPPTTSAPEPPRKLTVEERAALRRKLNLGLAIAGGLLLLIVFAVLSQLG